jgi:uncharacterized repeat protein (TIGR01451 family)
VVAVSLKNFFEPRYPPGGPQSDLAITKSDRVNVFTPGQPISYEIGLINNGPSPVSDAAVTDVVQAELLDCTWTCVTSEGSLCSPAGSGDIDDLVTLLPDGWADYVLTCNTVTTAPTVSNTVTTSPPMGVADPDPIGNSATDVNAAGAGRVPDGATLPGPGPLEIARAGAQLILSWGASCLPSDVDYHVYEGTLGTFTSHEPIACGTSSNLDLTHTPPGGDVYYLVVPTNLSFEGSYGFKSETVERPASASACLPQAIGSCP